jgi:hypothetical protein
MYYIYRTIKAQRQGTLHCHMLLWIEGNPNPQELHDQMSADHVFKNSMFTWIESIIKCQLPSTVTELNEHGSKLVPPPRHPEGDPKLWQRPNICIEVDDDLEFESAFCDFVEQLAIKCNWQEHKDTCFIHLRPGEPCDDTTCQMCIDGLTHLMTSVDPETQSTLLK